MFSHEFSYSQTRARRSMRFRIHRLPNLLQFLANFSTVRLLLSPIRLLPTFPELAFTFLRHIFSPCPCRPALASGTRYPGSDFASFPDQLDDWDLKGPLFMILGGKSTKPQPSWLITRWRCSQWLSITTIFPAPLTTAGPGSSSPASVAAICKFSRLVVGSGKDCYPLSDGARSALTLIFFRLTDNLWEAHSLLVLTQPDCSLVSK